MTIGYTVNKKKLDQKILSYQNWFINANQHTNVLQPLNLYIKNGCGV